MFLLSGLKPADELKVEFSRKPQSPDLKLRGEGEHGELSLPLVNHIKIIK